MLGEDMKKTAQMIACLALLGSGMAGCGPAADGLLPAPLFAAAPSLSPVATKAQIAPLDDIGQTFDGYFAQGTMGTAQSPATTRFGKVRWQVVDAQTIRVTTSRGEVRTYTLRVPLTGTIAANGIASSTAPMRLFFSGNGARVGWHRDDPALVGGSDIRFHFGHSAPAGYAGKSLATYRGGSSIHLADGTSAQGSYLVGDSVLTADFAGGTVSGTLFDNSSNPPPGSATVPAVMSVALSGARITGSGFSGGAVTSLNAPVSAAVVAQSGQAAGQFIGLAADQVIGAFGGQLSVVSGNGNEDWSYAGTFSGTSP